VVNQRRLRRKVAASKPPTIVVGEYFRVNDQFVTAVSGLWAGIVGSKTGGNSLPAIAVSPDGMKVFGVLNLATEMEGCKFSTGLRIFQAQLCPNDGIYVANDATVLPPVLDI
jgi:hypothetical protein